MSKRWGKGKQKHEHWCNAVHGNRCNCRDKAVAKVQEKTSVLDDLMDEDYTEGLVASVQNQSSVYSTDVSKSWGGSGSAAPAGPRCYESHPALPLTEGLVIYGGSCARPIVKDADIYIGFDFSMRFTPRHFPWEAGEEILFEVVDHSVPGPSKVGNYKKLVQWTIDEIRKGRKVHAGCIGGHGRTGIFLAAIVSTMGIDKDAIAYVRKHYCAKVVESQSQVDFLVKHFGVIPREPRSYSTKITVSSTPAPSKSYKSGSGIPRKTQDAYSAPQRAQGSQDAGNRGIPHTSSSFTTGDPIRVKGNVWGRTLGGDE